MKRILPMACLVIFSSLFLTFACTSRTDSGNSLLIQNAQIVDGTGKTSFEGSVRLQGNRIIAVGNLKPAKGELTYDARGLVLAPGFIDTHSHHDSDNPEEYIAALSQGISTIVVGQDGFSHYPLAEYFNKINSSGIPINTASYSGHNSIRNVVLGGDFKRRANQEEIDSMQSLLLRDMEAGALGLSTGLEYDPGIYSDPSEVVQLAKSLKSFNGRYISHMRSEDVGLEASIEEIINIAREADIPVQISHFKLARKSLWGKTSPILSRLDSARNQGIDITADVYPYQYWQSTMKVLFPKRDFDNIESARFALTELTDPDGVILAHFNAKPEYTGKTFAEIARIRNESPEACYLALIKMSLEIPGESIIARSMAEEDILRLMNWEHSNLCSDGGYDGHPRGWGAFPRYFRMAADKSLEERIHKMTLAAAQHMGFEDMGVIREGAYADLVLLNPEQLEDKADFTNNQLPSVGIRALWVDGQLAFEEGDRKPREVRGRLIKRQN